MKCLCYPIAFPGRPEDRLLMQLLSMSGIPAAQAELTLYRLWRDFGTGGSDRRTLACQDGDFELGKDPQVILLESSSGFTGESGGLVSLALKSGFLRLEGEAGTNRDLVCKDFYPLNAPAGGSAARSRGAYERARGKQAEKAEAEVAKRLELWKKTSQSSRLEAAQEKEALYFLQCVCRALHPLPMAADDELRRPDGLLEKAWEILQSVSADVVHATQRWLIHRRKDPAVRTTLADVVGKWSVYVESAKREAS